jgi:hypothetical protein
VNTSWHSQRKIEKSTKTKVARDVPVHPVLAEILDEWRESGWERLMGRRPTEEDLIAPFGEPDEMVRCGARKRRTFFGEHCDDQMMLKRFHKDLALLGAWPRQQHDARRTFISLTVGDGASMEILNWVTHAPPRTVMGDYTSLVWTPLCAEVAKLQVEWRREPAGQIAAVVNAAVFPASGPTGVTREVIRSNDGSEFAADPALLDSILDPPPARPGAWAAGTPATSPPRWSTPPASPGPSGRPATLSTTSTPSGSPARSSIPALGAGAGVIVQSRLVLRQINLGGVSLTSWRLAAARGAVRCNAFLGSTRRIDPRWKARKPVRYVDPRRP